MKKQKYSPRIPRNSSAETSLLLFAYSSASLCGKTLAWRIRRCGGFQKSAHKLIKSSYARRDTSIVFFRNSPAA